MAKLFKSKEEKKMIADTKNGICQVCGNEMKIIGEICEYPGKKMAFCAGYSKSCNSDYIIDMKKGTQVDNRRLQ